MAKQKTIPEYQEMPGQAAKEVTFEATTQPEVLQIAADYIKRNTGGASGQAARFTITITYDHGTWTITIRF